MLTTLLLVLVAGLVLGIVFIGTFVLFHLLTRIQQSELVLNRLELKLDDIIISEGEPSFNPNMVTFSHTSPSVGFSQSTSFMEELGLKMAQDPNYEPTEEEKQAFENFFKSNSDDRIMPGEDDDDEPQEPWKKK
jgi:hypothetical protein